MIFRKTYIIFGVFVLLVLLVLVVEKPFKEPSLKDSTKTVALFPEFDVAQAAKIEIYQIPDQKFELVLQEGQWLVASENNFPANQNEVSDLLQKVTEFNDADLVSKNPENQAKYQVTKLGIETKIMDGAGSILAHFFVGKNGPNYTTTYIRANESDMVYLEQGYLKSNFDKSRYKWRNRQILAFEKDDVDEFTLHFFEDQEKQKNSIEIVLQKTMTEDDILWSMTSPEQLPAKKEEVERIVQNLSNLMADDFVEAKELAEIDLEEPKQWVEIKHNDGLSHTLFIGNKEKTQYYVKNSSQEYAYLINEYRVKNLFKKVDELKADEKTDEIPPGTDSIEPGAQQIKPSITQKGPSATLKPE